MGCRTEMADPDEQGTLHNEVYHNALRCNEACLSGS